MHTSPLVSIITPVFNRESYIKETIRGVLNQTYENWEWIIFDDGSTDNTRNIIMDVRDVRIRYVFQENMGPYHLVKTFNKALSMSSGKLIAMLDSDDYWPDYKIQVQVKNFDSPDIVLSYGECFVINENGNMVQYIALPADPHVANNDPVGSSLKLFLLQRSNFVANSTVMLDKEALLSIGGFVEAKGLWQDYPTWTRLSLEGTFAANPLCLGYRRLHLSSTSYAGYEALMESGFTFLREFVMSNSQKLIDLGFSYDRDVLEEHWKRLNPYASYYTRAIVALSCGKFKEAKAAFRKFLEKDSSLKQKIIYFLVVLSSFLQFDLVNPLASLKVKLTKNAGLSRNFFNRSS
ncbi:MAG TPA: glycosyltransferase [Thermodesulfovibrionales bacterium]|nr:glycosyltransferase [Thermodesulfovibrionales bacterium]